MNKTFVFKLKPTEAQAASLTRYLDVTRDVYNAALEQRITAYAMGHTVGRFDQSAQVKQLREARKRVLEDRHPAIAAAGAELFAAQCITLRRVPEQVRLAGDTEQWLLKAWSESGAA